MRKNSFSEREWKMRREWLDKEVSSLKELTETLHLEIARLHLTRGYGEKAEEHLLTLKESKNKEVTNLLRRAEHMTKKVVMGHKQSVEVRLNKLVDQCVVELGLEYTPFEYQKQPANLEAELLWAITQRPVESKFYNFLALLKLYEQNWSEALAWSHEARRRETDNSRQEITHGFALYFNNRLTEAQQIFAAVPHIDSRVRRAGDYANMVVEITDQLQKAGISNSSSRRARIHLDMGNRHSTQKDWGNALFHYQEGLRFAPFHKDLTFNLGFVLLRLNRKKEANAIFKELFKDKTEGHRFAEHLHKLGYTWVELQVLGYSLRSSW
jgi:tetratricopeptide (TPR) repeat protein